MRLRINTGEYYKMCMEDRVYGDNVEIIANNEV
jgi:hypothetical protein